ncbi:hypothetical protein [Flavobacterium sp. N1994]|uniref:hypothetical protein n=1 Tax=Flavobacterium sp. N1994 TaxID=2986827 RepID=UPI0022216126|nr:hypothetical protein [Flavobacterium sp. N1994]
MKVKFNITDTVETEFYYGEYAIYILGGHYIKTNPDFYIQVVNMETNTEIELTEKYLKIRDFKSGRKAIKFYTFQINDYGKFKISAHNYNDIIVKDSMLEVFPFPFSITHTVLYAITGRDRKQKNSNDIEILIE